MSTLVDPVIGAGDNTFRLLDNEFVCNVSKTTWASYVVELSVTAPLLSFQTIQVDLKLRPSSAPPEDMASFDSIYLSSSQGGGLSLLSLGTKIRGTLSAFIPPGYYVELETSGNGTATFLFGQEATF